MNSGQPPPGSSSRRSGRFSGRLSGRAKKGAESPKKLNLDAANAQTSPETQSPTSSDANPWEEVADDDDELKKIQHTATDDKPRTTHARRHHHSV